VGCPAPDEPVPPLLTKHRLGSSGDLKPKHNRLSCKKKLREKKQLTNTHKDQRRKSKAFSLKIRIMM
jgi:hypothetical protein